MNKDQVKRFVNYMVEREHIRLRREQGQPWPWTKDEILKTYKFTNVRRTNDKTTKEFVKLYAKIPQGDRSLILYRCGLFRYFGTVAMARELWDMRKHDARRIMLAVKTLRNSGEKVFTGAYVITNGGRSEPKENVVIEYLAGLWDQAYEIAVEIGTERSWEAGYKLMSKLPGFGGSGFMTKEVLQDYLLCCPNVALDADNWTPVGPGARRGLNRVWGRSAKPITQQPEKKYVADCLALREAVQGPWLRAHPASGELTAHDVQFCLCEFDKYERARLGHGRPRAIYRPQETK